MIRIKKYIVDCIKHLDPVLFSCTTFLSLISIVTIAGMGDVGPRTLIMQSAMTVAGIVFTLIISNIDYHLIINKLWIFFVVASVALLGVTLVFGSSGVNIETSNRSWLNIPFINIMIQPSEFVKIALVCSFAKHISIVGDGINKPKNLLLLGIHAALVVGMILLSGDLGVALVYMGFLLIMLFCAGLSLWYLLGGAALLMMIFPTLWIYFLADYQKERIIVGFNPELDPLGKGQQALLSKRCIENGGFFGIGFSNDGDYVLNGASHTDFIYSTVCEKFGFFMGVFVILVLVVMTVRIFMIAYRCGKDMGSHICVGVAAIIIVQSAENIGMCLAMVPVVGITLPFVSYGGSSVLATYILVALTHSVSSHRPRRTYDRISRKNHYTDSTYRS